MKHVFGLLFVVMLVAIPLTGVFAQDNATIADIITESVSARQPEFTVLLEALQTADLLDTLSGDGPYLLFAPTDEAFASFFEELELTQAEMMAAPEVINEILLYHIAQTDLSLPKLVTAGEVATLLESSAPIAVAKVKKSMVLDDIATIIGDRIEASNGEIYAIDTVLLPPNIGGESGGACTISTPDKNTVAVRVGPGENRTSVVFLQAGTDFAVSGRFVDKDNGVWYKLDPAKAAPGRSMNEAWVSANGLSENGDCEAVGDAAAPPIIPITSSRPQTGGGSGAGAAPADPGALPQAGRWTIVLNPITNASCAGTGNVAISTSEVLSTNTFTTQISQVSATRLLMDGDIMSATGGGTYVGKWDFGGGEYGTVYLRVVSATVMTGELVSSVENCSATVTFTMTR